MNAPLLFILTTILGGLLRPGYSHLSDTISELFSPGSPNKLLLDTLHTLYAVLLITFGVGILRFVRGSQRPSWTGISGAYLYITMGFLSVLSATVFPQDAWGTPPTFPGQMHIVVHAAISLVSMVSFLMLGTWTKSAGLLPGFWVYSYITVGAAVISARIYMLNMGTPIMGLTERITGLIGLLWTFLFAFLLFRISGRETNC